MSKRETILEAARTLFLRDGFAGTSMDAVTALAGVSKATVYAHFKSKDELFASLVQETARPIFDGFPPLEPGGDPAGQLRRYLAAVRAVAFTEGRLWERLAIAEAGRHPAIGRLLHEMGETRVKGAVAGYLEAIGCPEPALAAATLLDVALIGPLHRSLMGVDEPAFADRGAGLGPLVRAVLRAHPPRAG
ncbi:MAG: TetR/AcrR family transcriptional regulator [Gemmataceae bacterium]|nr:TetR/AcrR family transcriptional regulator [Gemmataceae bacterium]